MLEKAGLWAILAVLAFTLGSNLLIGSRYLDRFYHRVGRDRSWWNSPLALGVLTLVTSLSALWLVDNFQRLVLMLPILAIGPTLLLIDAGCHKLPNTLNALLCLYTVVALMAYWHTTHNLLKVGLAIVVSLAFAFLFVPSTFIRRGIGLGDLKLMTPLLALTTCWSWHALLFMIVVSGFGLGLWAIYLGWSGRISRYDHLAMGPWLLIGAYVGLL